MITDTLIKADVNIDDLFRIGIITQAHGILGEVKVFPTTDDPGRIGKIKEIYMSVNNHLYVVHPEKVRFQKNLLLIKFKEISDRDLALEIQKNELYVTRDNAVKLSDDEYYINDLIGLLCYDENDVEIGVLSDVFSTGANDVYEIKKKDGNTFLLPAIKQCVLAVNISEGKMLIHVMEGLE